MLEGDGTVTADDGVGLVGGDVHLFDGPNSSTLVHAPIDKDVLLDANNGDGLGVMDMPPAFPAFMDVDDGPVTMGGAVAACIRSSNGISINEPDPGHVTDEDRHQRFQLPVDVTGKGKMKVDDIPTFTGNESYGMDGYVSHGSFAAARVAGFFSPSSAHVAVGVGEGSSTSFILIVNGLKRVVLILTTVFRFTMQVHRMIINVNFELLQPLCLLAVCSLRRLFSNRKPRSRDTPRIRQTRARAGSAVPVQDTRDNAALAAIANSAGKRPVADLQILGVANLKPSDIGKGVRVRVYHKWTVTSTRGARQPTLSFMLLDQQGGAIQPHVEARERNRFNNALQINGTCKENKARRVAAV